MLPRPGMYQMIRLTPFAGCLAGFLALSGCQTEEGATTAASDMATDQKSALATALTPPQNAGHYSLTIGSGPVVVGFLGVRRDNSAARQADSEYRDGAALAVNLLGGTLVRSVMLETADKPEAIRQATRSLTEKGAVLILTTAQGHELTEIRTALPSTAPIIAFSDSNKIASTKDNIFGFLSSPSDSLIEGATYAMAEGGRQPVILAETAGDTMLAQVVAAKMKEFGTKPSLISISATPSAKDLSAWQASDMVLIMPEVRNAAAAIRRLNAAQPTQRLRHIVASTAQTPADFSDPSLNTAIVCRYDHNLEARIGQKYLATYGMPASQATGYGFDAMAMAIALSTNTQTGQISSAQIANPAGFSGVMGLFRFTDRGNIQRNCDIFKVANGRLIFLQRAPASF